jgi:hypothetical protein
MLLRNNRPSKLPRATQRCQRNFCCRWFMAQSSKPRETFFSCQAFLWVLVFRKGGHNCGQTRAHLNVGYEFVGHAVDGERSGRYEIVLGAQYPLGYPRYFNTILLADVFTQQSVRSGESNPTGLEVGIRRQIAPLVVVDVKET